MWMAIAKQATTIEIQRAFAVRDVALEMFERPWIVEISKKSYIVEEAIPTTWKINFWGENVAVYHEG